MVQYKERKHKKNVESYEPPEDKFALWLTINDTNDICGGEAWLKTFKEDGEELYSSYNIKYAYIGMPLFIYLTSKMSLVAEAEIGSHEDLSRLQNGYEERSEEYNPDFALPLVNLTIWGKNEDENEDDYDDSNLIHKDELIELGIIKTVPIKLQYLSKNDYETITSLFEE